MPLWSRERETRENEGWRNGQAGQDGTHPAKMKTMLFRSISNALNSFSEEYRVPFNMYVAGYKYHEIADKLGLPLGTVKSRIFFARKRLREELADYAR